MEPPHTADDEAARLATSLLDVVGPLRRLLRRRVREDWPLEPLGSAQLELLRLVELEPGVGIAAAAARLRVAPNTVSTLVNQLVAAGLVQRDVGEHDRRTAQLRLTAAATARLAVWRERRAQVLRRATEGLGPDDRARIAAALPALERLVEELDR